MLNKRFSAIDRRHFIKTAAALGLTLPLLGTGLEKLQAEPIPYDGTLRDSLWMWGHESQSFRGRASYNIPIGETITQADAIKSLGIPNDCVVRFQGLPKYPFDDFIKQFKTVKRFAWSILHGNDAHRLELQKQQAFEVAQKMPNLTTLYLDDFFTSKGLSSGPMPKTEDKPAHLSLDQLTSLHDEIKKFPRPLELASVLYSHQLDPVIKPYIEQCDVVSYWTWKATELVDMERDFNRYLKIANGKRTLLGIYLWNFGNARPLPVDLMKIQCANALKWFKEKKIEGMIFHCTPLCGIDLPAVKYARDWIRRYGDSVRQ